MKKGNDLGACISKGVSYEVLALIAYSSKKAPLSLCSLPSALISSTQKCRYNIDKDSSQK